jgi:hypothetical protein
MNYQQIFEKIDTLQNEVKKANQVLSADQISSIVKVIERYNRHPIIIKKLNISIAIYVLVLLAQVTQLFLVARILKELL